MACRCGVPLDALIGGGAAASCATTLLQSQAIGVCGTWAVGFAAAVVVLRGSGSGRVDGDLLATAGLAALDPKTVARGYGMGTTAALASCGWPVEGAMAVGLVASFGVHWVLRRA